MLLRFKYIYFVMKFSEALPLLKLY